jgi:itaconate CoA-transferase
MTTMGSGPLSGIVVVSFEQAVSAPYCTRLLGDLGARVIKIEQPGSGDFTRHYDSAANGIGTHFAWLNRSKESLELDTKHPDGRTVLDALLPRADVVVQNLAPGAARRIGVDADSLVARYPRMVAVDISGYGEGGPISDRRAYDLLVQAEAGSCAATGWPGAPAKPGIPIADLGTGLTAALAISAALVGRTAMGNGAALKISMFDTMADLAGFALLYGRYTGSDRAPNGMGSPMVAPYGAYPTRDGRTIVLGTTNDGEWQRLARDLLTRPDLADDPGLASNEQRCARRSELDAAISNWSSAHDRDDAAALADAAGIGNAQLNSPVEVVDHPQLVERDRWTEVDSPVGPIASLLPAFICADWRLRAGAIPALGQHTAAIAAEHGLQPDITDRLLHGAADSRPPHGERA